MVHGLETMKRLNDEAVANHSPLSDLKAALQADEDYAWTWQCNLACIGMDSGGHHESANRYAAQFMKNAFGVDVTTQENWKRFESQWKKALSFNEAVEKACELLPERWEITLMLECGSGVLVLENPDCEEVKNDEFSCETEDSLSEQLHSAIKFAIENDHLFE